MPEPITSPEQVPDGNLRLMNLADEVAELAQQLGDLWERLNAEAYDGIPSFATDEENQRVIDRAEALKNAAVDGA